MDEQPTNTSSKETYQALDNEHKVLLCELEQKATLESINDDCLLYIFKYLSILEVSKVAATCTRLQNFANDFIYPKSAKQIQIRFHGSPATSKDVMSLKDPFESFGYFVESLSFVSTRYLRMDEFCTQDFEKILVLCPNLHTLSFFGVNYFANILKYVPSNLKEINFKYCEIPIDWCDPLKKLPQLNSVTFNNIDKSAGNFLKHITTLSSLTIDAGSSSEEDLMMFLNSNGRTLQTLELIRFSNLKNFESIVTLLPELKNLAICDHLSERLEDSLYKLPHLKFLKISCNGDYSTLLRILSEQNSIEELEITVNGILEYDDNEEPLIFKQLRKLRCYFASSMLHGPPFASLMIKSHMPAINSITLYDCGYGESEIQWKYILKLFESKKLLETFCIFDMENAIAIPLLYGIIEILKADRSRPFLTLHIPSIKVGTEMGLLHLLNANRHLVNVNPKIKSVMTQILVRDCNTKQFYVDESYY